MNVSFMRRVNIKGFNGTIGAGEVEFRHNKIYYGDDSYKLFEEYFSENLEVVDKDAQFQMGSYVLSENLKIYYLTSFKGFGKLFDKDITLSNTFYAPKFQTNV